MNFIYLRIKFCVLAASTNSHFHKYFQLYYTLHIHVHVQYVSLALFDYFALFIGICDKLHDEHFKEG